MNIAHIEGATRVLGAPANWDGKELPCDALPILDVETSNGNVMASEWKPTAEEIEAILNGAPVRLWIFGTAHPVVSLTTGDVA